MSESDADAVSPLIRAFISYAHDDAEHVDRVRQFWSFLREAGIDARVDLAAEERQDWPTWMLRQIRAARFVLVIASPAYRLRAEGDAPAGQGRGVQWEAALIREAVYADQRAALNRFLPVVLPGCSAADIPLWLGPASTTHYVVADYTLSGAEKLLRRLTGQPFETVPPLGRVPVLPPRTGPATAAAVGEMGREMLLRRLAERVPGRNEPMVQADVRQLLLIGGLGLEEDDLGVGPGSQVEDRRRIDIEVGGTVIEVRKDLRARGVARDSVQQLAGYLATREEQTGQRYVGVLTDGAE
jgi:hypothetical protein